VLREIIRESGYYVITLDESNVIPCSSVSCLSPVKFDRGSIFQIQDDGTHLPLSDNVCKFGGSTG
jgi:hypothetical protein